MELNDAASSFDDEALVDAYAPTTAPFYGQTDIYDGSKRDGTTVVRRVLSVVPGSVLPDRGAVLSVAGNLQYIVGLMTYDSFSGGVIREKYILQRTQHLANIRNTLQVLSASGGVQAYAGVLWLKNAKDDRVSSESFPLYNIYFSATEAVSKRQIIDLGGVLYRVKVVNLSGSGFLVAECYQFASVIEAITYTPGAPTKDVASDTYLPQTPLVINGLQERFLSYYDNEDAGRVKFVPGDLVMSIDKTDVASPTLQDFITLDAVDWNIMDTRDTGDGTWALHLRRK